MTDQMPTRIATIRSRAREHQQELESMRWLTAQRLAARWGVSLTTVYEIPTAELPYKEFGAGKKLKRRRYNPADVAVYEAQKVGAPTAGAA